MTGIKWEDPPEPDSSHRFHRSGLWAEIADELRAHPKRWAMIREDSAADRPIELVTATLRVFGRRIKHGETKGFAPAGSFETAVRRDRSAAVVRLYVRYIGADG